MKLELKSKGFLLYRG